MREFLRAWLRRQQYDPGPLGPLVNPFFLARRSLALAMTRFAPRLEPDVLDVGCGSQPYRRLLGHGRYVGLEVDSPIARARGVADLYYTGPSFPIRSGEFRAVVCSQVLEHVFNPDDFVAELHRVLAPRGQLLLTVPFVWDEHEQPWDYARYSSFGLRALLERHGFRVLEQEKLVADASLIFQLINAYIYKLVAPAPRGVRWSFTLVAMAPISYLGLLAALVLPRNPDMFLDQIVLACKE